MIESPTPVPRPSLQRATRNAVAILLACAVVCVVSLHGLFVLSGAGIKTIAAIVAVVSLTGAAFFWMLAPWREVSTERLERLNEAAREDSVVAATLSAWVRSGRVLRMVDYNAAMDLSWRRERARDERTSREAERRRRSGAMDKLRSGWPRF